MSREDEIRKHGGTHGEELVRKLKEQEIAGNVVTLEHALAHAATLTVVCSPMRAIPGSSKRECELCARFVWVAPSSQGLIATRGRSRCVLVCPKCVVDRAQEVQDLVASKDEKMAAGLMEPQPPQGSGTIN